MREFPNVSNVAYMNLACKMVMSAACDALRWPERCADPGTEFETPWPFDR